jgi:hypothetical protein
MLERPQPQDLKRYDLFRCLFYFLFSKFGWKNEKITDEYVYTSKATLFKDVNIIKLQDDETGKKQKVDGEIRLSISDSMLSVRMFRLHIITIDR